MKEFFIDDQYVVISKDDYRMLKEEHALLTKQAAAKASVPENVTLKGEVINPMMIDGVRFINRKDAAKILDVGFPTLSTVRMLPRFWMLAFLPYGDGTTKVFFMPSR